jgi:chromosome segregation ATPase
MAFPVELLTTRALCDEALAELQTELDDLTFRQASYDRRDDKATARATDIGEEIAVLDRDVADLTAQLAAMPADSKYRPRREAELRTAVKRRGDLGAAQASRGPLVAFRTAVDLRQVAAQVAELTTATAEVTARRATLPA